MDKRPNIIFFFSDQQRWDTVGCYGQKLDITPNLDKMAAKGIRFEYAFTPQPVCGPARACLQTGKYGTETGCYRNDIPLPLDEITIAERLNEAGYETGYVGKWHLASNRKDLDFSQKPIPPERRCGYKDYWVTSDILEFTSHGYDGYMFDGNNKKVEFKGYRVDCVTDFALDFIRTRKAEKPFFMFLSHIEPHHQNDRNRYEGPEGSKEKFKSFELPGDLVDTNGRLMNSYPDYLGCCNSLDYNLGRIIDQLEKQGIADNTVIIYTSDHGCHFVTRNGEYKRSCHESSIRVPMIISGPGFEGGKVISELVSLLDASSTILKCAGIAQPESMKGRPLQELMKERVHNWPQEAFIQISETQVGRAIRTKKWKYSVNAKDKDAWNDSSSDKYTEDFLYDLENDPYERSNLVDDLKYTDIRKDLAKTLIRRMVEAGEVAPIIEPIYKE